MSDLLQLGFPGIGMNYSKLISLQESKVHVSLTLISPFNNIYNPGDETPLSDFT